MLHKRRALRALKGNAKRQLRILLGIKARPKAPVLIQPIENVIERHGMICRDLLRLVPESHGIEGGTVCEIGPGDCLATAAVFAGLGAKEIDLVELNPPVVNEKQVLALTALHEQGLPVDLSILRRTAPMALDGDRIRYHMQFVEEYVAPAPHDFLFSYDVFEHVEDLPASFAACERALKPGGQMLHVIDIGGHGEFEDPLPPLDFQTYSDWFYEWMYPKFHRATRRFVNEYRRAAEGAGFTEISIVPLRTLDAASVQNLVPRLREAARQVPLEELAIIEFAMYGTKRRLP